MRATTLKVLAQQLRQRGRASEIHVRIGCPPIISPCFYGIDMSSLSELYAPKFVPGNYRGHLYDEDAAKMARSLGVDSLRYLSVADLARCLQLSEDELCNGCVTGKYPTPWGNKLMRQAIEDAAAGRTGRTYEK